MNDPEVESLKLRVDSKAAGEAADLQLSTISYQPAWQRFKRNRPARLSAWYLAALLLAVIAWPLLLQLTGGPFARSHSPNELSDAQFLPPGAQHWFGTAMHGRV